MGRRIAVGSLLAAIACGSPYSTADVPSEVDAGPAPSSDAGVPETSARDAASALPECRAQRVLEIVAGNGSLSWFTLVWPLPDVITGFQPGYSYDDPKNALLVVSDPAHPLYARTVGSETVLEGTGMHPFVTAFVAGHNQSLTNTPSVTITSGNVEVLGIAAVAQQSLAPKVPVVSDLSSMYVPYAGGPAALMTARSDDFTNKLAAAAMVDPAALTPDAATLASWSSNATEFKLLDLTKTLYVAAKAFEKNLVGTVIMTALDDSPNGAFTDGDVPLVPNAIVHILDSFYSELAKNPEPSCSHNGQPISLADNTVLLVTGDDAKEPYVSNLWPEGTVGGANLVYVRSNGFLTPGWFGRVTPTARVNFDPDTGALDPTATSYKPSTDAAIADVLYAIVRGDAATTNLANVSSYGAAISPP